MDRDFNTAIKEKHFLICDSCKKEDVECAQSTKRAVCFNCKKEKTIQYNIKYRNIRNPQARPYKPKKVVK